MQQFEIKKVLEISSTNEVLKEMAKSKEAKNGQVLIAQKQTEGHGQYGRSFESPIGGLYMSICLQKQLPFETEGFTQKIGKIVQETIKDLYNIETDIKEPNDILYQGKKLCGILVESFTIDKNLTIIIGFGINLNSHPNDFSNELKDNIETIANIYGKNVDSAKFVESILERMIKV